MKIGRLRGPGILALLLGTALALGVPPCAPQGAGDRVRLTLHGDDSDSDLAVSVERRAFVNGLRGLLDLLVRPGLWDEMLFRQTRLALLQEGLGVADLARLRRGVTQEGATKPIFHVVRSVFGDDADALASALTSYEILPAVQTSFLHHTRRCWTPPDYALSLESPPGASSPRVDLGVIGAPGHGQVALSAAILRVLGDQGLPIAQAFGAIPLPPDATERGITINTSHVEYQTDGRHYAHVDCPGHADYVKNMVTGAAQMDGAVLVVSAPDGPLAQTREHVLLARQVGVAHLVGFLNDVDLVADPAQLDLVEEEMRELLSEAGFDGENTPIIRGSALRAAAGDPAWAPPILELLDAVHTVVPLPPRDEEKPFSMPVEDVFATPDGTVATGRIETGLVAAGDAVEIGGLGAEKYASTVTGIEMFRKILDRGEAGDNVGLLLRGIDKKDIRRGMVIAKPGTITPHARFKAEIYVLKKEEGGRHTPFHNKYRPNFYFRTTDVTGEIELPGGRDLVEPGDQLQVQVQLIVPVAMDKGLRFAIREGGRTVGAGQVTEIIE